ncbi:MAG: hypothetical protein V1720_22565 [bacterium]
MSTKRIELLNTLLNDKDIFFRFMKNNYPLFFNSNIFLRDIQYCIQTFFHYKKIELRYTAVEDLALQFADSLEKDGQLIKNGNNSWKVNFILNDGVTNIEKENIVTETV